MQSVEAQLKWRKFLVTVLDTFGQKIKAVEFGNTLNRKRWAGYDWSGFMQAWRIAHQEITSRNITLIGPNVQDFEPLYNLSLFKTTKTSSTKIRETIITPFFLLYLLFHPQHPASSIQHPASSTHHPALQHRTVYG